MGHGVEGWGAGGRGERGKGAHEGSSREAVSREPNEALHETFVACIAVISACTSASPSGPWAGGLCAKSSSSASMKALRTEADKGALT
jgi:hypothetical protein